MLTKITGSARATRLTDAGMTLCSHDNNLLCRTYQLAVRASNVARIISCNMSQLSR